MVEQPVHTRYVPGSSPGTATHGASLPKNERVAAVARVRRAVAAAADRRGVVRPGESVLVACSGGPDSMAMLDALIRLAPPRGWRLEVAHVDHGLRKGSDAEADVVAALTARADLPLRRLRVQVAAAAGSLQERARAARLGALHAAARKAGATAIALGHTADDQAETVLMRALTSGSPRGLAAMGERDGPLSRPLLRLWRTDTEAYCRALGLAVVDDPSNRDARFLRTRVRHELLPAIEAVLPGARRRLVALADRQRQLLRGERDCESP